MNALRWIVLIILVQYCWADDSDCTWTDPANNQKYDLTSLMNEDYEVAFANGRGIFAVCEPIHGTCEATKANAGMCYHEGSRGLWRNAGVATDATISFHALPDQGMSGHEGTIPEEGVQIVYSNGEEGPPMECGGFDSSLTTYLNFHCDLDVVGMEISGTADFGSKACELRVDIKTPTACPTNGISLGTVLCIIVGCSFFVYCCAGCILNHQKGERGLGMMPNREFWSELPKLSMEGCRFSASGCKRGGGGEKGGYDQL